MALVDLTKIERIPGRAREDEIEAADSPFYTRQPLTVRRYLYLSKDLLRKQREVPVNPDRTEIDDPTEITEVVKEMALKLGADVVGIADYHPAATFSQQPLRDFKRIVVFGKEFIYDSKLEIGHHATLELAQVKFELDNIAVQLNHHFASWGYAGSAMMNGGEVLLPVAGYLAGLGELGKHGSIISKEHGSTLRLGAVATEMPLKIDGPKDHGVDKVCQSCQICTRFCPGEAISPEKYDFHGIPRWRINTPKCEPFLFKLFGCKICMMVCPFGSRGKFKEDYKNTAKSIREAKTREGLLDKIVEQSGIDFEKLNVPVVEHYPDGWDSEK